MQRIVRQVAFVAAVFVVSDALALPSYKDGNWGVVPQDHGGACVVVLNSEDRMHAFHFAVDGVAKVATVGILDTFVPDRVSASAPKITIDLGPLFRRQLKFEHRSEGSQGYLAADLSQDDLKTVLAALQSGLSGVSLSFANGEVGTFPALTQQPHPLSRNVGMTR